MPIRTPEYGTNRARSRLVCAAMVLSLLELPQVARTQDVATSLRFEVASVRMVEVTADEFVAEVQQRKAEQSATHRRRPWPSAAPAVRGTRVDMDGIVMRDLISLAYGIEPERIRAPNMTGVPRLSQLRYVIHAIMPEGSTKAQMPDMLRALLQERFLFQAHREVSDQAAFGLVAKVKAAEFDRPRELDRTTCENWLQDPSYPGAEMCSVVETVSGRSVAIMTKSDSRFGPWVSRLDNGSFSTEFLNVTMPQLAAYLSAQLSVIGQWKDDYFEPVVDRTGLDGAHHVALEKLPADPATFAIWNPNSGGGPVEEFSAALARAGLKLVRTKAPVEQLIIDRLRMVPTDN